MASNQKSKHPIALFSNVLNAVGDLLTVVYTVDCSQKRNNGGNNNIMDEVGDYEYWLQNWDKQKFMQGLDEEQKELYGDDVCPSEIWFDEKLNERRRKQQMKIRGIDIIYKWLKHMEMERYFDTFITNGYDTFSLIVDYLNEDELNEMKVKRIHQKRILDEIKKLKKKEKK